METDVSTASPDNIIYMFTLAAIAVVMVLESIVPRRELQQGMLWRWSNNFALSLISRAVIYVASIAFIIWLTRWTDIRQFGLFHTVEAPAPVMFLTLLAVSQFFSYWVHVALHRVPWLWPIHAVHHSDVDIDVSTSYRHHPLEPLVSLPIVTPIILLLGVSAEVGVAFKLFEIAATLLSHANLRIPEPLERYLRFVILTPDFHRLHHCSEPRYTNSNYGSLVPWFDYVFGSASHRPFDDQESMELGLEYLREPVDGRLDRMLWEPVLVHRELRERD